MIPYVVNRFLRHHSQLSNDQSLTSLKMSSLFVVFCVIAVAVAVASAGDGAGTGALALALVVIVVVVVFVCCCSYCCLL